MTREEAIKILKAIRVYECYPKSASEETKEAIDMAIEALKEKNQSDSLVTDSSDACKESESKLDLISRQDAIRWVKTECNPYGKPTLDFESGKRVMEHLEQMPSAETKTGEWIRDDDYICDQCGYHMIVGGGAHNFCPNCGADMRGEKHE